MLRGLPLLIVSRADYDPAVSPYNEREILERTVHAIAERAKDAYRVVEEAHEVDPRDESGLTAAGKRLRMELLQTKAELERELGNVLLSCQRCNRRVQCAPASGPSQGTGDTRALTDGPRTRPSIAPSRRWTARCAGRKNPGDDCSPQLEGKSVTGSAFAHFLGVPGWVGFLLIGAVLAALLRSAERGKRRYWGGRH
jgi:hypothetical protein